MDNKIVVGIHQPNFMPWLGYFYKIYQSDKFIFLDDAQFPKTGSSYINRVSIVLNGESKYITIPVKRFHGTWKINETLFANEKWKKKITSTIEINYSKTKFFKKYRDFIFSLINFEANNLAEYNINFIENISNRLEFKVKFYKSSTLSVNTTSTHRLIELIKKVNGNIYLSGSGGDKYQDHNLFKENNIHLIYNILPDFSYSQYKCKTFIKGVSIIDSIFNIGFEGLKESLFI